MSAALGSTWPYAWTVYRFAGVQADVSKDQAVVEKGTCSSDAGFIFASMSTDSSSFLDLHTSHDIEVLDKD